MSFFKAIETGSFALPFHVSGILWNGGILGMDLFTFVIVRQFYS